MKIFKALGKGLAITFSLLFFSVIIILTLILGYTLVSTFTGISAIILIVFLASSAIFYFAPHTFDVLLKEIGFK